MLIFCAIDSVRWILILRQTVIFILNGFVVKTIFTVKKNLLYFFFFNLKLKFSWHDVVRFYPFDWIYRWFFMVRGEQKYTEGNIYKLLTLCCCHLYIFCCWKFDSLSLWNRYHVILLEKYSIFPFEWRNYVTVTYTFWYGNLTPVTLTYYKCHLIFWSGHFDSLSVDFKEILNS